MTLVHYDGHFTLYGNKKIVCEFANTNASAVADGKEIAVFHLISYTTNDTIQKEKAEYAIKEQPELRIQRFCE